MRPLAFASVSLSLSFLLLTGCAGIPQFDTTAAATTSSLKGINGHVHGGQQPLIGAHVYLFSASHRVTPGTPTASTSLMTSVATGNFPTTLDSTLNAYYVTTDTNGAFSVTSEYSCNSGGIRYMPTSQGATPVQVTIPMPH